MNRIALAMICKGDGHEPANLRRALSSVAQHVDGIYITLTGDRDKIQEAEKVCQEFKVNVSYHQPFIEADEKMVGWLKTFFGYDPKMIVGDKMFLFDEARNYSFAQVPKDYDWILWMDTDDVIRNANRLHELADAGVKQNVEAFYFNYLYQVELEDNKVKHVIIQHLRERLVRNIGIYKWIAPIHETLIEQRPSRKQDIYEIDVVHLSTDEDRMNSLKRNLTSLELSIYKSEGKDPRHIYYLAKAFFDLNTPEYDEKCIPLINKYLNGENPSGWPEERSQACEYLAEIYRRKGQHNNAIKAAMNALIEQPEQASIFLNIASSYMIKQEWERALYWVRLASSVPEKKTTLVKNPKDIQARTLEILYNCSLNMNKIDEAWAAAVKMIEMFPKDPSVINAYKFIENLKSERDITVRVMELAEVLKKTGERGKIKALLHSVPQFVQNNPFMQQLYQQNNPPTVWGEKDIAIYCGQGYTNWSPKQLSDPKGSFVGGSEEAVIYMAKALSDKGWNVTVYNDPGQDEGVHDGVTYLPFYKFNRLDRFNILIAWRDIRFFDGDFKAKKKYLWCHDIQNPIEYTKERMEKITKVFFLSQWHRDNVSSLPDEKVLVTSNGINI